MNNVFIKTQEYTTNLIDRLKSGEISLVRGQWVYSKKFNKMCKYVGTFTLSREGVVKPVVIFSYPKKGEDAIAWNKRFKEEYHSALEESKVTVARNKNAQINKREVFIKVPNLESNIKKSFIRNIIQFLKKKTK